MNLKFPYFSLYFGSPKDFQGLIFYLRFQVLNNSISTDIYFIGLFWWLKFCFRSFLTYLRLPHVQWLCAFIKIFNFWLFEGGECYEVQEFMVRHIIFMSHIIRHSCMCVCYSSFMKYLQNYSSVFEYDKHQWFGS